MNVPRKVVFFNGPPHCGKDTIVRLIDRGIPSSALSFAEPLKLQCAALLGVTLAELELIKDKPHPALKGGTPRTYLINLSEKMIKPYYGNDFFGHVALDKINHLPPFVPLVLFSDSGFVSEAAPVVNQIGLDNCVKIEIYREGCDFTKDSRSYWQMDGLRTPRIDNNGSLEEFRSNVLDLLSDLMFI